MKGEPNCGKQMYAEPAGSQPVSEVMELYVDNPTVWIDDYILAHEKMIRNGYPGGLTPAPPSPGIVCPMSARIAHCYLDSPGSGEVFLLGSKTGGGVLENDDDAGTWKISKQTGAEHQQWQWSSTGNQLMNVATGLPLMVQGQTMWEVQKITSSDWIIRSAVTGKNMFRQRFNPIYV